MLGSGERGGGKLKVDVNGSTRGRSDERGVFQRLMSPSTYTGIHKHRMEKTKSRGEEEEEAVREARMAIEGGGISPVASFGFEMEEEDGVVRSKKVKDYVNRNVFERLRETETESRMVKKRREGREVSEARRDGGDGEVKVVKVNLR